MTMKRAPRKPSPFQRPRVQVSSQEVKREWRMTTPERLEPGDVVANRGLVHEVSPPYVNVDRKVVLVRAGEGVVMQLPVDEKVLAFVRVV